VLVLTSSTKIQVVVVVVVEERLEVPEVPLNDVSNYLHL
jgi:hypothetical protein